MSLQPEEEYENIKTHKLYSDSLSTSFVIWVKTVVKPHYHRTHSESIYVLEGQGLMKMGPTIINLKPGVFVKIPMGSVHSVEVNSGLPLKVISVQAPEFFGKDRIFMQPKK